MPLPPWEVEAMIEITRLNDDTAVINAELIEMIEARPDTIVTMTTGRKIIVEESVMEVVKKVIEYRQVIRPIIRTNAIPLPVKCPAQSCPLDIVNCGIHESSQYDGRVEEKKLAPSE